MRKSVTTLLVLVLLIASCLIVAKPALSATEASENYWTSKTSMPSEASVNSAVLKNKIYAIGVSNNYEYNPTTDAWTVKQSMPTPRSSFAVAACQNKLHVIGGRMTGGPPTGIVEVYDPAEDTWETKTPMPTNRYQMEANMVNDKIYVIGGRTGEGYTTVALNEVYDPADDSWTTKAPIPYPVVSYASVVVDNKIYVLGGQDEFHPDLNVAFNQIYDSESDTWSQGAPIPVATILAAAGATTGKMAPKRIYVLGGAEAMGLPTDSNYVYDPQENAWSTAASLLTPRYGLTVAVVDDLLYAIGGIVGFRSSTAAVEQYIPFGFGTVPPIVSVISPENKIYASSNVFLAFVVNKPVVWLGYSLDGQEAITVTGNATLAGLTSGLHNITGYARDEFENAGTSQTITFSVEEPFPTVPVAAAFVAIVAVVGVSLLVYFKKRNHQP